MTKIKVNIRSNNSTGVAIPITTARLTAGSTATV
jgi:hypothetical protein